MSNKNKKINALIAKVSLDDSYLTFCLEAQAAVVRASTAGVSAMAVKEALRDKFHRPVATLNRDLRVAKSFEKYKGLIFALKLDNARSFLQDYTGGSEENRIVNIFSRAVEVGAIPRVYVEKLLAIYKANGFDSMVNTIWLDVRNGNLPGLGKLPKAQMNLPYWDAPITVTEETLRKTEEAQQATEVQKMGVHHFPIPGTTFFMPMLVSGNKELFVLVEEICNVLGISSLQQWNRIERSIWNLGDATVRSNVKTVTINPTVSSEQLRHFRCLNAFRFGVWMGSINELDVPREKLKALVIYQVLGVEFLHKMQAQLDAPTAITPSTDGFAAVVTDKLAAIQSEVRDLAEALAGKSSTAIGEFATVLPKDAPEDKGYSASSIVDEFNSGSVFLGSKGLAPNYNISLDQLRSVAVMKGLIGDQQFGHWSMHATTAHGNNGNGHWRFNERGRKVLQDFIRSYGQKAPELITKGYGKNPKEVFTHMLSVEKTVGKGTHSKLTIGPSTNGQPSAAN